MRSPKLALVAALLCSGAAVASTFATIEFTGLGLYETGVNVFRADGSSLTNVVAGELIIEVDGVEQTAYCIDLDNGLTLGLEFEAELVPDGSSGPACEANYLLRNYQPETDAEAAALQVALWKLFEDGVYVSDPTIDAAADALVLAATGQCPLTCDDGATIDATVTGMDTGLVYVDLVVGRSGDTPVAGQEVSVSLTSGTLVSPADGIATTDSSGVASIVVDPDGSASFDLLATLEGSTLFKVDSDSYQQLLVIGDECSYETTATWEEVAFGSPRTIGFWKHQVATATGEKGGNQHVDTDTLEGWLPIETFGTTVWTLQELYDLLWIKKASMEERAVQQCTALQLNIAYGEVGWFSDVDFDADGVSDAELWEYFEMAQDAADSGNWETAKDICDTINNL